jgi:aminoglycoside phosphotransferase (APT) family kinase protein
MIDVVRRIAARHAIAGEPVQLAGTGMINDAWRIGDHVLRMIRNASEDPEVAREIMVAPLVAAEGVRTPPLVAFDVAAGFAPRPYTIYRWVEGALLGESPRDPRELAAAYHALGGELARIARVDPARLPDLQRRALFDPRAQIQRALVAGAMTPAAADEVTAWLATLEPILGAPARETFVHRDIHPWNLMIDAAGELVAIIDWGDASIGDPALELAGMPLVALPDMLAGYRAGGGVVDRALIARAIWGGIALAAWELRELDPAVFDRRWWRMPLGGWREHRALADELLASAPT